MGERHELINLFDRKFFTLEPSMFHPNWCVNLFFCSHPLRAPDISRKTKNISLPDRIKIKSEELMNCWWRLIFSSRRSPNTLPNKNFPSENHFHLAFKQKYNFFFSLCFPLRRERSRSGRKIHSERSSCGVNLKTVPVQVEAVRTVRPQIKILSGERKNMKILFLRFRHPEAVFSFH